MSKKYTIHGQEVHVHAAVAGGHIISHIYETDDGDEQDSPKFSSEELFDKPPVEKLEKEVTTLESRIAELSQKRTAIDQDLRKAEASRTKLMAKFKDVPALEYLEQFLDGKITHFVTSYEYGCPHVVDFKEEITSDSEYSYDPKLKLLVLYGDSKGDLQWRLSQYHDGSGMKRETVPCCSLEEALAKCKAIVEAQGIATNESPRDWVVEGAKKFSAVLPEGYEKRFLETCIKGNTDAIDREQAGLDARKAKLETMKERLAAASSSELQASLSASQPFIDGAITSEALELHSWRYFLK